MEVDRAKRNPAMRFRSQSAVISGIALAGSWVRAASASADRRFAAKIVHFILEEAIAVNSNSGQTLRSPLIIAMPDDHNADA